MLRDIAPLVIGTELNVQNLNEFSRMIDAYHYTWGQHKALLMYLHENVFTKIDCVQFAGNLCDVERYILQRNPIVERLKNCRFADKLASRIDAYNDLARLETGLEVASDPGNIVNVFREIMRMIKVTSLKDLFSEIRRLTSDGNGDAITQNKIGETVLLADHQAEVIAEAVKSLLEIQLTGAETDAQIIALVKGGLNKYADDSTKSSISQHKEQPLLILQEQNRFVTNLQNILQLTEFVDILGRVKSMVEFLNKLQRTYGISNERSLYQMLNELKSNADLLATSTMNEDIQHVSANIGRIMDITNSHSTKVFVDDLQYLRDQFNMKQSGEVVFSLKAVASHLNDCKVLTDINTKLNLEVDRMRDVNSRLEIILKPLAEIRTTVDTEHIADFMRSILKNYNPKQSSMSYLKKCLYRLQQYPRIEAELQKLKNSEIDHDVYETQMKQLSDTAFELKRCKQQREEYEEELAELRNKVCNYEAALEIATEHNLEQNRIMAELQTSLNSMNQQ